MQKLPMKTFLEVTQLFQSSHSIKNDVNDLNIADDNEVAVCKISYAGEIE
jgi:hypothetical protein